MVSHRYPTLRFFQPILSLSPSPSPSLPFPCYPLISALLVCSAVLWLRRMLAWCERQAWVSGGKGVLKTQNRHSATIMFLCFFESNWLLPHQHRLMSNVVRKNSPLQCTFTCHYRTHSQTKPFRGASFQAVAANQALPELNTQPSLHCQLSTTHSQAWF